MITDYEREQILEAGSFLEEKGYSVEYNNAHMIVYSNGKIEISIVYPPNGDMSELDVKFEDANEVFSIGWIALVRHNLKTSREKLKHILELLNYVKSNYLQVIDYRYCKESNKLINGYVAQHPEIFEKAVQDFLESCRKS